MFFWHSSNFQQANKKDAKFAPTNSTTRMGKTVSTKTVGKGNTMGTYNVYREDEQLNVAILKYRMRHVLQSWGFLKDEHAAAAAAATSKKRPAATPVAPAKTKNAPAPTKRSKND